MAAEDAARPAAARGDEAANRTLIVDRRDGVVTALLNRPERRNAIDTPLFRQLQALFEEVSHDRDSRVLVLRGGGGSFSSGADLTPSGSDATAKGPPMSASGSTLHYMRSEVSGPILALHRMTKPTIAVVEGIAAGAGANLALGCDLVLAAEGARFSQIFVRRGLSLDCGGSWLLPRLVGLHRAKELAFYGDWVDARDAERIGLVNRVFPAAELDAAVEEWATRLAAQAPTAVSLIKKSLDDAFDRSLAEALDAEAVNQGVCTGANDFREAMSAFLEKRAPKFTGG